MLTWIRTTLARTRELFTRSRIADEQDEEFRFHLEMEVEHNRRLGMSDAAARQAAAIAFGGRERFRQETRDARGFVALDNLARDTRFALRRIRRSPGFAVGAIVTLGIGIGVAVGIGGIVYGVLLRDLPYQNPDALVRVSFLTPGIPASGDLLSGAPYAHFAGARSFSAIGAYYTNDGINLSDGPAAERVTGGMVTPGTFRMLGVTPVLGQLFAESDTSSNGVLIAQDLWERRYGSDPNIIGKRLEINRGSRLVIGVLPQSFDFPSPAVRIWYPSSVPVDGASLTDRYYNVIARLAPDATVEHAEAELKALIPSLSARYPTITPEAIRQSGARATVMSLKSAVVGPVRGQLALLGVMVVVVLLIATTNVVTLFLLRAERASHEIAIALSLGATRAAIARRFMVEGMVLGAASVFVALPVAATALATKLGFRAREIPRLHEIGFGPATIAAVVVMALVVGGAIGLAALTRTSGGNLGDRLRGAARATASPAWRRMQRALVATQIAIAVALLVAAGLLGRSFWNLRTATLGFDPAGMTTFEVALPYSGYASYGESAAFHARVIDGLRGLPGVTGAAGGSLLPLAEGGGPERALRLEALDSGRQLVVPTRANFATSDYFRVMDIPMWHGRSFAAGDLRGEPAIVLSTVVARALFGHVEIVGHRVRRVPERGVKAVTFHVVGVVGNVSGERIEDGAAPLVYLPLLRDGDGIPRDSVPLPLVPRGAQYVVRGSIAPTPQSIRQLIHELDKRVPVVHVQPVTALVDAATARVRLTLLLLGVSGCAALLLGVVGVYSVVSYAAAGRMREFGVRLALGATPRGVASMVLHEGAILAAVGVAIGLGAAWVGTRFLASLLFEVSATNAPVFVAAAVLLVGVTLLATLVPARRASRTDPAVVLRGV